MDELLTRIRNCHLCSDNLPFPPRPVVQAGAQSRILIIGQAPGMRVQQTGIPFNDPSGDELRRWLNVTREEFYDDRLFAIMPMGFCYPGKGTSGDLPPCKLCAPEWHGQLLDRMPDIGLSLLIGQYAQKYYLGERFGNNLTETVRNFGTFLPDYFPLVHPSPRNRIWQARNPWFEEEIVPALRQLVDELKRTN